MLLRSDPTNVPGRFMIVSESFQIKSALKTLSNGERLGTLCTHKNVSAIHYQWSEKIAKPRLKNKRIALLLSLHNLSSGRELT